MEKLETDIKKAIRNIPDYPKKGVAFKDLTTLWEDGRLTRRVTDALERRWKKAKLDKVVGVEARGFIVGAPLADRLGIGFVPARKVGKLPAKKVSVNYELEYGRQGLEMHANSVSKGERVLIVDDLLATGGTSKAAAALVEKLGGKVVGLAFVTELSFLKGREKLTGYEVYTLSRYD
ncbi:MAG: adenine phosphoribosyltransferase [Nitrososphaerota archaeon]|jgi:adenine phosphoribosyltransferase|nr:adenine phosphoribosyltransferase [Nitrososphaerota archaeon]MCL5672140.1 adenine phosphoribosyltransferase [Nitrososphaerota archaeon]MDG6924428.1 adenine phosphoribosyltransferase [Nitrososphaerota archaeon]MDG6941120.1 adenine phosphoribosyltransferase [Nitrososphaerota archaeon]MDG6945709.1 adenine phosphoribosyltransferase [Nitrososphaerota archaeon]